MKTGRELKALLHPVPIPRRKLTKTGRRKAQLRNYERAIARAKLERREARDQLGRATEKAGQLKKANEDAYNDIAILAKKLELATSLLDSKEKHLYTSLVKSFPKVRSLNGFFKYTSHQVEVDKRWDKLCWRLK